MRNKTLLILFVQWLLMMTVSFPDPVNSDADGYMLFRRACTHYDSLNVIPKTLSEVYKLISDGGSVSEDLALLLRESQGAFTLIGQAATAEFWNPPDRRQFDASTTLEYITAWRTINRLAVIRSTQNLRESKGLETFQFLAKLNDLGMKVVRTGMPIDFLSQVSNRRAHYPVIVSAISELSENELRDSLAVAIEQYRAIPHLKVTLAGNEFSTRNEARNLFDSLRQDSELKKAHEAMMAQLQDVGFDETTIDKIRAGDHLSISQWESSTLSKLKEMQAFLRDAVDTWPSDQLDGLDDEIERRINETWSGEDMEKLITSFMRMIENDAEAMSPEMVEKVHHQVGQAICHQYLQVAVNYIGRLIRNYRAYIASERLLIIEIAARVYTLDKNTFPESLQALVNSNLLEKEMTIDPLTGDEFIVRESSIFQAYSVGQNLKDEGGIPYNGNDGSGDIILLPAPEIIPASLSGDSVE